MKDYIKQEAPPPPFAFAPLQLRAVPLPDKRGGTGKSDVHFLVEKYTEAQRSGPRDFSKKDHQI